MYSITPSAHPIKCSSQCPSFSYSIPPLTFPSLALCLFPRVRSLSWFLSLFNFSHSVPLLSLIIPFTISYIPCMSETIWWLSSNWLTSLSIPPVPSTLKQMVGIRPFWWLSNIPLCVCMCVYIYIYLFIHSSVEGYQDSFHSLAVVDIASINIGVQLSQHFAASVSLGQIPSSAIAGS